MLGQEDNPGAIQAEIERAKLAQAEEVPNGENQAATPNIAIFAPDSYLSKSVPQRLAIIVAGVVMNFFFAIICAAGAYMSGVKEEAPAVGNVIPGSPAWEAGVQPGDRITAIDGAVAREFKDIRMKLIEGNETIQLTVDRQGESITTGISPRRRSGDLLPNIGVVPSATLELHPRQRLGHWAAHYSAETIEVLRQVSELNPMRIEKVEGQAVNNFIEYQEAQLQRIGQPITYTIGGVDVKIPAVPMRTIPVRFKMGAIAAVQSGSDAEKQGIKAGDTIVSIDGDADVDPFKLPQILLRKVNAEQKNAEQKTVELVIRKADGGSDQTLTLELAPVRTLLDLGGLSMRDPLGSTALGLSWGV